MTELPQAFLSQMAAQLKGEMAAFLRTYDEPYQRGLRVNPWKRPTRLPEDCGERVLWEENGHYLALTSTAGADVLHEAGAWYLQEPSAMLPAAVLNAQPGEHVLDLCAAPGGKSTQSGLRMGGQGVLVCNEPVWERAKILSQNIERMGIPNALVVSAYPDQLAQRWPEAFDAIQVDAPCSGEGMFRRHPETRAEWSPESPAGCAKRQAEILDRAAEMLRPGGRMVYSTCTMNRTENEDTVDAFLSRHTDFSLEAFSLPGADAPDGMLTCYPHRMKGEGHFVALLRKHGDAPCNWQKAPEKDAPSKDALQALRAFCPTANANVMRTGSGKPGRSRDESVTLSCLPDRPVCDGIQVVRCGLQLGTVQKKLFVPDHAWAMSIFPPDVPRVALSREDARRYQAGETLPADGKGWALACCDGIPLGWGKISDGQMKNHYPKGLRRPLR